LGKTIRRRQCKDDLLDEVIGLNKEINAARGKTHEEVRNTDRKPATKTEQMGTTSDVRPIRSPRKAEKFTQPASVNHDDGEVQRVWKQPIKRPEAPVRSVTPSIVETKSVQRECRITPKQDKPSEMRSKEPTKQDGPSVKELGIYSPTKPILSKEEKKP
jgi:hypothetical protein